jgi:5'-nucleotidase
MIDALNVLGVDFATFGHRDFEYGVDALEARLNGVDNFMTEGDMSPHYTPTRARWITSNLVQGGTNIPAGGKKVFKLALIDWVTSQVGNADGRQNKTTIKVGVLAVSDEWVASCMNLKTGDIEYLDYIQEAQDSAKKLKAAGAEVIIGLTHQHLPADIYLTRAVPEIDLILGGADRLYERDLMNRIVKSGEEFRWLSHVQMTLRKGSQKPELAINTLECSSEVTPDPAAVVLSKKYERISELISKKVIFSTSVDLDMQKQPVCMGESLLANWICDILAKDYSLREGGAPTDFCLLQGGVFNEDEVIPAGPITMGDVLKLFPKRLTIVLLKLTGKQVISVLKQGASRLPRKSEGLIHCSSTLSYGVNIYVPNVIGCGKMSEPVEVIDVMFQGKLLRENETYVVAMTDRQASGVGGEGDEPLKLAERLVSEEYAAQIQDLIIMHCNRHMGDSDYDPANSLTGRITIQQELCADACVDCRTQ